MYTKFLLLVIFLFFVPVAVSIGSSSTNPTNQTKPVSSQDVSAGQKHNDTDAPLAVEAPSNHISNHHSTTPCDDDCKTHFFHYNRFKRRRLRLLFEWAARIILFITHVCSMFSGFMHFYHR